MKRKQIVFYMLAAAMVLSVLFSTAVFAGNDDGKTWLSNAKVIEVSGETEWLDVQAEIDAILAADPNASVKILGVGDNAVIRMIVKPNPVQGIGDALELRSDTAFENVVFQLQGQQSTNQSPNIAIFANGHKLYIAEDVKTVCVGGYAKLMFAFGGSRETEVASTDLEIYGGTWAAVYGGSYRVNCGDTYVRAGGKADVRNVYGGMLRRRNNRDRMRVKYKRLHHGPGRPMTVAVKSRSRM